MQTANYIPLVEVTRGSIVESVHYGSVAICNTAGDLVSSAGDSNAVTFLRSSAKPFQALAMVESGGVEHFKFTARELAVMCASHSGTDEHVRVISGIHQKIGVTAADLMCGMHSPGDVVTAERMFKNSEENSPLRHNCSGKHTSMLVYCRMHNLPIKNYIDPSHPLQKTILKIFSEMTGVPLNEIALGTDGCSAPVFAVPMRCAARAFAQLGNPSSLPEPRQSALRMIFKAMTTNPDMVAGPGAFDTVLMEVGQGKILTKGGAEGYQAIALLPGACGKDSPALGITIKISDGDQSDRDRHPQLAVIAHDGGGRARTTVAVEILHRLGALDENQFAALKDFTTRPQFNWRNIEVGEIRTSFDLK
jgi:L-asparaginase II